MNVGQTVPAERFVSGVLPHHTHFHYEPVGTEIIVIVVDTRRKFEGC